jgi:hypothetical protein
MGTGIGISEEAPDAKQELKTLREQFDTAYRARDVAALRSIEERARQLEEGADGRRIRRGAGYIRYAASSALLWLDPASPASNTDAGGAEPEVPVQMSGITLGIVLAGAGLMLLAVFLPRVEARTFTAVADNTLVQSGQGWWFIGLAIGIALAAWRVHARGLRSPWPMLFGLAAIAAAIYYGTAKSSLTLCPVNQDAANALGIGCSKADPGVGIYAAGVGGLLALIGGFRIWYAKDEEEGLVADDVDRTTVSADTVEERLRVLDRLRETGAISAEEHATRRAAVLAEI